MRARLARIPLLLLAILSLLLGMAGGLARLGWNLGPVPPWSYLGSVDNSPLSSPGPSWSPLASFMNGGSGAEPPSSPATA